MKTRDRILYTSLHLFNTHSERTVTTNHIAAAMNISPGNLYYYFKNKEAIIFELFCQYEERTRIFLQTDRNSTLTWNDVLGYFQQISNNIWDYRFLHRDMEQLLNHDPRLLAQYRHFAQDVMQAGRQIMHLLKKSGLIEASDQELDALIINTWVIATGWAPFLHSTAVFGEQSIELSQAMIHRGMRQIIYLIQPYLSLNVRESLPEAWNLYTEPTQGI